MAYCYSSPNALRHHTMVEAILDVLITVINNLLICLVFCPLIAQMPAWDECSSLSSPVLAHAVS